MVSGMARFSLVDFTVKSDPVAEQPEQTFKTLLEVKEVAQITRNGVLMQCSHKVSRVSYAIWAMMRLAQVAAVYRTAVRFIPHGALLLLL